MKSTDLSTQGTQGGQPRHIIIKMAKIKDKDRVLKAAREKKGHLQRKTHQAIIRLLNRNPTGQKRMA